MLEALAAAANQASAWQTAFFNHQSARKQMQFQERMSDTQYQRSAADLEAAGLNRVLALGSPAGTPQGAAATMPDARLGDAVVSGSSAKQAIRVGQAQERLLSDQSAKTLAETTESESRTHLNNSQALEIASRIPTYAQSIGLMKSQGNLADAQSKQDEFYRELHHIGAEILRYLIGGKASTPPLRPPMRVDIPSTAKDAAQPPILVDPNESPLSLKNRSSLRRLKRPR